MKKRFLVPLILTLAIPAWAGWEYPIPLVSCSPSDVNESRVPDVQGGPDNPYSAMRTQDGVDGFYSCNFTMPAFNTSGDIRFRYRWVNGSATNTGNNCTIICATHICDNENRNTHYIPPDGSAQCSDMKTTAVGNQWTEHIEEVGIGSGGVTIGGFSASCSGTSCNGCEIIITKERALTGCASPSAADLDDIEITVLGN